MVIKKKGTAILLSVLFGMFGWLYTYQDDAWKFWLNLAITVLSFGLWGLVAWVWAIIDACTKDAEQLKNYGKKKG